MFNDEVPDDDIPEIINMLRQRGEDIEEYMESSFRELSFLGGSPKSVGGELLDAALINVRLCISYFLSKEDYIKVATLHKIYESLKNPKKAIVDEELIKSIKVFPN
jgi:hypothetical protein